MTESITGKPMRVVWLLYFTQFVGIGIFYTFLNVYFLEVGLSGTQIGLIGTSSAVVSVFGAVLWGTLSDRIGKPGWLLAIGAVGGGILVLIIPLVHTFLVYLGLACLSGLMGSSANTLIDSTTLTLLGKQRDDYGRYRLGGSIGYIVSTVAAGLFFDWGGLRLMFFTYALVMIGFAGVAMMLPSIPLHHEEQRRQAIGTMVRRPAWILFVVCIFLCWVAINGAIQFLGVSMKAMGANQSLIGSAMAISAIIEVPFMMQSSALVRRFGAGRLLWLSMFLMTIRFVLLGWMPSPGWAVPINALNGSAFGFFWSSAIIYANKMAPASLTATAQGLFSATLSLAGMVGAVLCGWLFDQFGPNGLYYVLAMGCLAAFILFGLGQLAPRPAASAGA